MQSCIKSLFPFEELLFRVGFLPEKMCKYLHWFFIQLHLCLAKPPYGYSSEWYFEKGRGKKKTKRGELEIVYRFGDSLAVCKGGTFPYLLLPDLSVW